MLAKKYRLQIDEWLKDKKKRIFGRKSDFFVVKTSANNLDFSRFGVVISAKVSKSAVVRNRIRRTIFNFIRLNKFQEIAGNDVLIIVLPPAAKLTRQEIENNISKLIL